MPNSVTISLQSFPAYQNPSPWLYTIILYFFFFLEPSFDAHLPYANILPPLVLLSGEQIYMPWHDTSWLDSIISITVYFIIIHLTWVETESCNPVSEATVSLKWIHWMPQKGVVASQTDYNFYLGASHCDIYQVYPPLCLASHHWLWIDKHSLTIL